MVGDGVVVGVACRRRGDHLPERRPPVRPVGVGVEVATEVVVTEEVGQVARGGGLDLAAVLAEFGRDVREAERRVHLRLRLAGDPVASALARPVAFVLRERRDVEDAVLVHLQAALDRAVPEFHVVVPGAGEILECGAELRGAGRPQVDPGAVDADARLRLAGLDDRLGPVPAG